MTAIRTRDDRISLFHYTTAAGLIGIVENDVIWATHASFLNDTQECKLLTRLLSPQIHEEFKSLVPKLTACGAFRPDIMQQMGSDGLNTESDKVISAITNAVETSSPIYVASFCMHAVGSPESDHGLLSSGEATEGVVSRSSLMKAS